MEAAILVKPFGFDRVFHMTGGEPPAMDSRALNDRIEALEARIAALRETHQEDLARAGVDGFEAGLAQARQERNAAVLAAADAIHAAIEQVDAQLAETTETFARDAADVALAAAEMLAGHAIDVAPPRAIGEALDRVLRQVAAGTRLTVRVHPTLLEPVERLVAERTGAERRQLSIVVTADAGTAEGDALIFWEEGGLAVDAAARRAAVLAELRPLIGTGQALAPSVP
jgi:flagellar assembly protein FliH